MRLTLTLRAGQKESSLIKICEKKLHAPCRTFQIIKKSLDARDRANIKWVYTVECDRVATPVRAPEYCKAKNAPPVVIAGMGPCGLFCALRLLDHGVRPVLLERGKPVEEREADVTRYREGGKLDPESNVQFGEGGAGTFSDGKLNTQTNDARNREVLSRFVAMGAPKEIAYLNKPHIGSDNLLSVVKNMRNHILARGGEIRYGARLTDIEIKNGALSAIYVNGVREEAKELVLAVGHSARDTFDMLFRRGFPVEQKEFAVGVRVEHLQTAISRAQYGQGYAVFPPADYKLVSHAGERAAFSFCMCPGGVVMPSESEEGGIVTNGMSNYLRDGKNANSALVVQVKREDFAGEHPLAGVAYQRKIERAAYAAGGGKAPVQLLGDFLAKKESYYFGEVKPTYSRGTSFAPLEAYLPKVICESLRLSVPDMGARLSAFASFEAVLTGVESRTSSPVRVVRGDTLEAAGIAGVYPAGEGCGYAGGITSAAADGLRVAEAIAKKYS